MSLVKTNSNQNGSAGFSKHATEQGVYWTSGHTLAQIRDLCRRFDRTKTASIGGEQETGFEQSFSSLAYAYLKDKAPRLLDHIVGFQLVDRNEDNTKAVGVFGFQVGKQWLYAPVFFLNGDLKGHELLYIKNQDAFVPMKENWVNYILSRKPHMLGEGSPKDVFQLGGLAPNIERMAWPPAQSKFGCDEWAREFLPVVGACHNKQANFLYRAVEADKALAMERVIGAPVKAALADFPGNLEDFLAQDFRLAKLAHEWTKVYPGIKLAFDRFYGPDLFTKVAFKIQARVKEHAQTEGSLVPAPKPKRQMPAAFLAHQFKKKTAFDSLVPAPEKVAAGPGVQIKVKDDAVTTTNLTENELNEEEKAKILRHGYLVKDERKGNEVSKVYNVQVRAELQNPHETGLYDVLESPGSFTRMLVISNPMTNAGKKDFITLVTVEGEKKRWVNAHRLSIYAKKVEADEDFRKWFDKLGDKDSLAKDGMYVALNARGEGTVPFKVRQKYENDTYRVDFRDSCPSRPKWAPRTAYSDGVHGCCGDGEYVSTWDAKLILNKRKDASLRAVGGDLHVPETFKFLKIKSPPPPPKEKSLINEPVAAGDWDGSEDKPINPGDIKDIQLMFSEKTGAMKLYGDHNELTILTEQRGRERYTTKQALFCLIREHGLREATAEAVIKAAQSKGAASFRVLYGTGYPLAKQADNYNETVGPGPGAPPFPQPERGSEQMGYNTANAIYPQEEFQPIPGLDSSRTDPRTYDPFLLRPSRESVTQAQQAGQTGQKEVFDVSMIGGLLKAVRQDSLVDRYLGDLMKALDRLGRILFLFYWHGEEFQDRYGKEDIPELEDTLRNAFETLGDLGLWLKEKTIEPGLDEISDPEIEDASKV